VPDVEYIPHDPKAKPQVIEIEKLQGTAKPKAQGTRWHKFTLDFLALKGFHTLNKRKFHYVINFYRCF